MSKYHAERKPQTIEEYIRTFPDDVQQKLQNIPQIIRNAIPNAEEDLKWSKPAFVDEQILVMFGGFKKHIGFYTTPSSLQEFEDELADFTTESGSVQFPYDEPLPTDLITKIIQYREWESKKKGVNWKS